MDITRRKLLLSGSVAAVGSLSGCMEGLPFEDEEIERTYTAIDGITVKAAPDNYASQSPFIAAVSSDIIEEHNVEDGDQIRVKLSGAPETDWSLRPALYTVRTDDSFEESATKTVWLTPEGLKRIRSGIGESDGELFLFGPQPQLDTREEARIQNEYIEQSVHGELDTLLFCAPNGGEIEERTDVQALRTASEMNSSAWITAGYDDEGRENERWKIDPTLISTDSYPLLARLKSEAENFEKALSFRKLSEDAPTNTIILSGLAPESFQTKLRDGIADATSDEVTVRINYEGDYSGIDTQNIVNQMTESGVNGVQILQSPNIIEDHWRNVIQGVQQALADEEVTD